MEFRYERLPKVLASLAALLFVVVAVMSIRNGAVTVRSADALAAAFLFLLIAIIFKNHRILLKDDVLILYGLGGRETKRIPRADIVWVTSVDSRGLKKGNEGWTCQVTTRRGDFTFTDQLTGYADLARMLEQIARSNPSI